ncbi:ribosomal protein L13 domain-containing protein, partial [Phlebopus sp. FC_14]
TALAYARVWHHVDASDRVLGKLAERIALVLMGKHKPIYDKGGERLVVLALAYTADCDPGVVDCGDYVVVTNARNIKVSGNKEQQFLYRKHTMYPGGLKETPYNRMMETKPHEIIMHAVSGMLPKNKLRDRRLSRLKVFGGSNMGIYRNNILKRWEDGTLTDEYILRLDPQNRPLKT